MSIRMKISKKRIYTFLLILFGSLFLNIMVAKFNGLYNSRFVPKEANLKLIPWKEVFQEWDFILYRTIGMVLIGYIFYFLFRERK